VTFLEQVDGFLEVGVPVYYVSTVLFLAALAFLLLRRLFDSQVRYISIFEDYFALFLLLGIGLSGFWMRHVAKTDVVAIKEMVVGLASFDVAAATAAAAQPGPLFYGHLFLVSVLLVYFPFSKLVHMPGVFMSPTRNLANNNRRVRHVNPWDYPVKTHPYDEYEDEWREKMKEAGVPVEKE
jgi:nitrate reductase gamma subunit